MTTTETRTADAAKQADVLRAAADQSPHRAERVSLTRRSSEWRRAARNLTDAAGDGYEHAEVIAAGSLTPGMILYHDGETEFVRYNGQASNPSVLVRDVDTGSETWLSVSSNTAPLVVTE